MKIEEVIKQKDFKHEYQKAMLNIYFVNSEVNGHIVSILKDFDVTQQQFNILRILRGQYPEAASINLIKDRMLDRNSDVSRLIERLRLKKMVERKVSKTDRRQMDVIISDFGLKLLKRIDEREEEFFEPARKLTEEEARTLNELLDKMVS